MLSIKFAIPEDVLGNDYECDTCGLVVTPAEAKPIEEPLHNLQAGDVIPAGQCPYCVVGYVYIDDEHLEGDYL